MEWSLRLEIGENLNKRINRLIKCVERCSERDDIPGLSKPSSLNFLMRCALLRDWMRRLSSILLTKFCEWCLLSFAKTLSWCASYSSLDGYILEINISKLGSCRRLLLDISFFRQVGHSLLPLLRAVMMHSWQKRWRHSLVVIVHFNISRHIGHISSLWRLRGLTAISVPSVITSWGVRCSS